MKPKTIVTTALTLLVLTRASATALPSITNTVLPSGRKILVMKLAPVIYQNGSKDKTLMLSFASDYPLEDKENLSGEVSEIWAALIMDAEKGGYNSAVISAQRLEGSNVTSGKAYNFVLKKDASGKWTSEGNPQVAKAAQVYWRLLPLLQKQQFGEAIGLLNTLVTLWPQSAQCYLNRGACYLNTKNLNAALDDFNEAVTLDPKLMMAYNNRGSVLRRLGRNDEALADWNKAIELDPNSPQAYVNRGALNVRLNRDSEALPDLDKAIQLAPTMGESYWWRGTAYGKLHKSELSKADLEESSKLGFKPGTDTWTVDVKNSTGATSRH